MQERERPRLIPLKREDLRKEGIPVSPETFRYWRQRGKHRELFVKIGRRVFLDMKAWIEFVEKNRGA